MLSKSQLNVLSKKYKVNESIILREYIQLLVLSKIYSFNGSEKMFFKGGTCIHLVYGGQRFSEDLDFTVNMSEHEFLKFIIKPFEELTKENGFVIKEKKSVSGKDFLLSYKNNLVSGDIFVKLDFSFREKVLDPKNNILNTNFPVTFNNYIHCLSENEILSEKIRAILTRNKGRDYYDLWYMLSIGATIDEKMLNKKMKYYKTTFSIEKLISKVDKLDKKEFIVDLKPFIKIGDREKLGSLCGYIKDFISISIH